MKIRLSTVLVIKIFCTIVLWSLPLLFYNSYLAGPLGFPDPQPRIWVHLLGAAFFALIVGYELARRAHRVGRDVTNSVIVGIVSNGLASLILWVFGIAGAWAEWGSGAQIFMWGSAVLTALIAVGLLVTTPQAAGEGLG